jgi:hypothetical protein
MNFIPVDVRICDLAVMRQAVRRETECAPSHIITTRLDNDDAIHESFVDEVQNSFIARDFEAVNFKYGYILNEGKLKLYFWRHPCNHFISLIEKWDNFRTVYVRGHTEFDSANPVRQIKTIRGWLTVIHQHNAVNDVVGIRWPLRALEDGFSVLLKDLNTAEATLDLRTDQAMSALTMVRRGCQRRWARGQRTS